MLVSPAERDAAILALGTTSSVPEDYGADMLDFCRAGDVVRVVGIQRKEWKDLLASVGDGRLAKEVQQLSRCDIAVVVIEGRLAWTADGTLVKGYGPEWTRQQIWGLMWSLQDQGIWVMTTGSPTETADLARALVAWARKPKHQSLHARGPRPRGVWGTRADETTMAAWVLQGFPPLGVGLARAVVEHLGMPLQWTVSEEELRRVPGIGKKKARQLIECLPATPSGSTAPTTCASCSEPLAVLEFTKGTPGGGTAKPRPRPRSRGRSGSSR